MIRRSEKSCKEGVCSIQCFRTQHAVVHVSAIMHILPGYTGYRGTYIRGGGGGGMYFRGIATRQQISVKTEGVLIFGGVLIYGVLRYLLTSTLTCIHTNTYMDTHIIFVVSTYSMYASFAAFPFMLSPLDLLKACCLIFGKKRTT